MTRHRDAADARRRAARRAAHPVQVTAEPGAVRVQVGSVGDGRLDDAIAWADLTPTEARALAGVLEAVAADVERLGQSQCVFATPTTAAATTTSPPLPDACLARLSLQEPPPPHILGAVLQRGRARQPGVEGVHHGEGASSQQAHAGLGLASGDGVVSHPVEPTGHVQR